MRRNAPTDGTVREIDSGQLRHGTELDDPNAVGPEDDACLEIDFIRGRVSIDLSSAEEDRHAEGPASDGQEIDLIQSARTPKAFGAGHEDQEVGPELDLEHLEGHTHS